MLRFAPSPIGDMKIDDLRVAIFNYIIAKQQDDRFLVRIDDIDREKNIEGKDSEIMMILEKFAIRHDMVYHQSEHLNIHQNLALRLLKEKRAFICRCDSKSCIDGCQELTNRDYREIKESGDRFVIRIKKPKDNIIYRDIIRGEIVVDRDEIGDFVIMDRNNRPTYEFASSCDDILSGINYIIRRDKYLHNTAKEIHIKNSLEYMEQVKYAHIADLDGGDITIKSLFEEGFIPDAISNYLLLSHTSSMEIFTLSKAIEKFNLESIANQSIKFDINRLKSINREHLRLIDDRELSRVFGFADVNIGKLAKLYLQETSTINELEDKIQSIFKPKDFNNNFGDKMRILERVIANSPEIDSFDEFIEYIKRESRLEGEDLLNPLKLLLTGSQNPPKLSEIYPLIKSYILEVAS